MRAKTHVPPDLAATGHNWKPWPGGGSWFVMRAGKVQVEAKPLYGGGGWAFSASLGAKGCPEASAYGPAVTTLPRVLRMIAAWDDK